MKAYGYITPSTGDQLVAGPLPTHRTTQMWTKRTQISMPRVEFEPMTPVFERAKAVHALDRAATVISRSSLLMCHYDASLRYSSAYT
jgi:hypothetical protein